MTPLNARSRALRANACSRPADGDPSSPAARHRPVRENSNAKLRLRGRSQTENAPAHSETPSRAYPLTR
eukprot:8341129-Alexandrium_andersonii.AAC.1